MHSNNEITLDNETIVKLAVAIATAIKLSDEGKGISTLTRKVLETLATVDLPDQG